MVNGLIHSELTDCTISSSGGIKPLACTPRMISTTTVLYGSKNYEYVINYKDQPNKGIYIHLKTAMTSVTYTLIYKMDVPFSITEHTTVKNVSELSKPYYQSCPDINIPSCTAPKDIPNYLRLAGDVYYEQCCICGHNAFGTVARGPLTCGDKGVITSSGAAISKSCLEFKEPWYSIYEPSYPPEEYRIIRGEVYEFDGETDNLPDFKKIDTIREARLKKPDMVQSSNIDDRGITFVLNDALLTFKNDKMDIKITRGAPGRASGKLPDQIDKFVAIPVYPSNNQAVMGSSIADDCLDPTWDKKDVEDCSKSPKKVDCITSRCTRNIYTIDKSFVDTSGNGCDKIGYSTAKWYDENRLCNSAPGTCLHNQLEWYIKKNQTVSHLPKLYGTYPRLRVIKIDPNATKQKKGNSYFLLRNQFAHQIVYHHSLDDYAEIKIGSKPGNITVLNSYSPGFITIAKMEDHCVFGSTKPCYVGFYVTNTGFVEAQFTLRFQCFPRGKEVEKKSNDMVAHSPEHKTSIPQRSNKKVSLKVTITNYTDNKPVVCNATLYSSKMDELHHVLVPFKAQVVAPRSESPRSPSPAIVKRPEAELPVIDKNEAQDPSQVLDEQGNVQGTDICTCSWYNAFCVFGNFKSCMKHWFMKVYLYISIGCAVLILLVLLPVLIPIIRQLWALVSSRIKASVLSCKRPVADSPKLVNNEH
ncbi:bifunctional HAP2-GCS1/Generative cell specific-1-HAP2 domain [Babesia duncani]|uniref:Bifunctional HAP2-GCS1/Generative cell specific-1-HAP2 domain n=1 Tax=Babesia duncani TaxID=323732 RepID=A0AAD9UP62_9APIC|nr:bifunctional HAP2-GCS1/Generative cell specific-1-HAP2 domain [Babesia duncani]